MDKAEQPLVGGDGRFDPPGYRAMGTPFDSVNRNTRSVTIDLAKVTGKAVRRDA